MEFKTWNYVFTCKACRKQWHHEYANKPGKQEIYELLNNYRCEGCK